MSIVVLDGYTLNPGDLSWDRVAALGGQFLAERSGGFRLFVSVPKGARQRESASSRR